MILGGYDSSKWTGDLVTLPILAATDGEARLNIDWTSIFVTGSQGDTTDYSPAYLPYPAVLDSGYTLTVLGNELFDQFARIFAANLQGNIYKADCNPGTGFSNAVTISVPFSELAVPNALDDTGGCVFGFIPAGDQPVVSFGDAFLRSAYVTYGYDAMTISLAQASYSSDCRDCVKAL